MLEVIKFVPIAFIFGFMFCLIMVGFISWDLKKYLKIRMLREMPFINFNIWYLLLSENSFSEDGIDIRSSALKTAKVGVILLVLVLPTSLLSFVIVELFS